MKRQVLIVIGAVIVVPFALWLLMALINSFDQPLRPEVEKILETKTALSESQEKTLKQLKESGSCREDLDQEQMGQLLNELSTARLVLHPPLETPGIAPLTTCVSRLVRGAGRGDFLEGIIVRAGKDPRGAIAQLNLFTRYLLDILRSENTAVFRLIALGGLEKAVQTSRDLSAKHKVLLAEFPRKEIENFLATDPEALLSSIRDSEIREARGLILIRPDHRWLQLMSIGTMEQSHFGRDLLGRLTSGFYQPNRTTNKLYDKWDHAIAAARLCLTEKKCEEEPSRGLSIFEVIVNPVGNYMLLLIDPRLNGVIQKWEGHIQKIRGLLSA